MHKPLGVLVVLVASLAIAVPLAIAEIVPNKSVADIELRMTPAEVKDAAGKPDSERVVPHEIVGRQRLMTYGKTKVYFSGTRKRSEVIALVTKDPKERTRQGVGIGSRKRAVVRRLNGIRCQKEFGIHHCYKGRFRPGKRVTDFVFNKRNRVKRITVGIVID